MREVTIQQGTQEIKILDVLGDALQETIRSNYASLRRPLTQDSYNDDMEAKASLHNIRVSLNNAFEEVGRRGYARVVFLQEEDKNGKPIKEEIFRLSQANAGIVEAPIRIV